MNGIGAHILKLVEQDNAARVSTEALLPYGDVFVVGGAVRDTVMGKEPHDLDLMAQVPAETIVEVLSQIKGGKVLKTGERFPVYRFKYKGDEVEIALPRTERKIPGGGNKDWEIISDPDLPPEADMERRDFTANAIAVNVRTGDLIDPFGGVDHIKKGILKTVSPYSFRDDSSRTLRAMTAFAKHGLIPDEETREQMRQFAPHVMSNPGEALGAEFDKMMSASNPAEALRIGYETGVLEHILPEVHRTFGFDQRNPHHTMELGDHLLEVVAGVVAQTNDPDIRIAALFHDIGKPDSFWEDEQGVGHYYRGPEGQGDNHEEVGARLAGDILRRLKFPTRRIDRIQKLILNHMFPPFTNERGARKFLNKRNLTPEEANDLLTLRMADHDAKGTHLTVEQEVAQMRDLVRTVSEQGQPTGLKGLAINGNDLVAMGFKGPEIGRKLQALMEAVVEDPLLNERETLLEMARTASVWKESVRKEAYYIPGFIPVIIDSKTGKRYIGEHDKDYHVSMAARTPELMGRHLELLRGVYNPDTKQLAHLSGAITSPNSEELLDPEKYKDQWLRAFPEAREYGSLDWDASPIKFMPLQKPVTWNREKMWDPEDVRDPRRWEKGGAWKEAEKVYTWSELPQELKNQDVLDVLEPYGGAKNLRFRLIDVPFDQVDLDGDPPHDPFAMDNDQLRTRDEEKYESLGTGAGSAWLKERFPTFEDYHTNTLNHQQIYERYRSMLQKGEPFAPFIVTRGSDGYIILDGSHRFAVAQSQGLTSHPAFEIIDPQFDHTRIVGSWKVAMPMDPKFHQKTFKKAPYMYHDVDAFGEYPPSHPKNIHRIESILREGLIPWNQRGRDTAWSGEEIPRLDHVYISDEYYVQSMSGKDEPPALRIDMRMVDPSVIDTDEDLYIGDVSSEWFEDWGIPNPSRSDEKGEFLPRGEWAENYRDIVDSPEMVEHSYDVGTLAIRGVIPPEAIDMNPEWEDYTGIYGLKDQVEQERLTGIRTASYESKNVAELEREVMEAKLAGGITWDRDLNKYKYDGYFTSVQGHEEQRPVEELTAHAVLDYRKRKEEVFNQDADNLFGLWIEGGKVFFDVSRVFQDEDECLDFAIKNKQYSYFNSFDGKVVDIDPALHGRPAIGHWKEANELKGVVALDSPFNAWIFDPETVTYLLFNIDDRGNHSRALAEWKGVDYGPLHEEVEEGGKYSRGYITIYPQRKEMTIGYYRAGWWGGDETESPKRAERLADRLEAHTGYKTDIAQATPATSYGVRLTSWKEARREQWEINQIKDAVRRNLTTDFLRMRHEDEPHEMYAYSLVATEALYHLLGGRKSGYVPMMVMHGGEPYWWVRDLETGVDHDMAQEQFGSTVQHYEGHPKALPQEKTDEAKKLIKTVQEEMFFPTSMPELDVVDDEAMGMSALGKVRTVKEAIQKLADYEDVKRKAKSFKDEGRVFLDVNTPTTIMGSVDGLNDVYDVEITRQDPNSNAVTSWHCSCPWGTTFAWDRTRQWKRLEGRMCSHALATFWTSQATPLDPEPETEGEQLMLNVPRGPAQSLPGGPVSPVPTEPQGQQLTFPEPANSISPLLPTTPPPAPMAPPPQSVIKAPGQPGTISFPGAFSKVMRERLDEYHEKFAASQWTKEKE